MEKELMAIKQHYKDKTQEELARRLGVSQPTVSRMLKGENPKGSTKRLIELIIAEIENATTNN